NAGERKDWGFAVEYWSEAFRVCAKSCTADLRRQFLRNIALAKAQRALAVGGEAFDKKDWEEAANRWNEALRACENYCTSEFKNTLLRNVALAKGNQGLHAGGAAYDRKDWNAAIKSWNDALRVCVN